jgi:uncharacterized membrane protein YdjX (TVP38/TMEM64 family)
MPPAPRAARAQTAKRVMPVVPFRLVSYRADLIGVPLMPYTLGPAVRLLPVSVMYAAIGASTALIA